VAGGKSTNATPSRRREMCKGEVYLIESERKRWTFAMAAWEDFVLNTKPHGVDKIGTSKVFDGDGSRCVSIGRPDGASVGERLKKLSRREGVASSKLEGEGKTLLTGSGL